MSETIAEETQALTPIQEMIVAALEDRAADVGNHFQEAVLTKIEEIVEDRKAYIAATLFMPDGVVEEDTVEEDEQIEEAKKKADKTGDESGNSEED